MDFRYFFGRLCLSCELYRYLVNGPECQLVISESKLEELTLFLAKTDVVIAKKHVFYALRMMTAHRPLIFVLLPLVNILLCLINSHHLRKLRGRMCTVAEPKASSGIQPNATAQRLS